jgi:hypothetical protein
MVFLNTIPPYYWSYYSVPIKPSYSGWSWSILSAYRFPWTHLCTLWLIYYVQLVLSSLMFLNWGLPANSFDVDNKSSRRIVQKNKLALNILYKKQTCMLWSAALGELSVKYWLLSETEENHRNSIPVWGCIYLSSFVNILK